MANKRFQVYVDEGRIEAVKKKLPGETESGIFSDALALLEWALAERDRGHAVTSLDGRMPSATTLAMPRINLVTSLP